MAVGIKELAEDVQKLSENRNKVIVHDDPDSNNNNNNNNDNNNKKVSSEKGSDDDTFTADADGGYVVSLERALAVHKKKSSADVDESCESTKDFQVCR